MWSRLPPAPPGFIGSWADRSSPPPGEEVDSPVNIPLGAQLDLSSLGSLQVIVSYNSMMGQVWYQHQSRVISWTSLQLAPSEPSNKPDSPP